MPEGLEEKEKCVEKLNQMQKYLPFLDFMIDRINKKNNAASLESQLSKFTHIRSMIAEKDGRHTWDVLMKVEDVIKKLISNLDYKIYENLVDDYYSSGVQVDDSESGSSTSSGKKMEGILKPPLIDRSMEHSSNLRRDMPGYNPRIEQGGSKPNLSSATTTTISVTTASTFSQTITTSSSMGHATSTVDLIMKRLKMSIDQKNAEAPKSGSKPPLTELLGAMAKPIEKKPVEADLNKDLDGFDLTEESEINPVSQSSLFGRSPQALDLLASSRQKLLKSVQKKVTSDFSEQNKPRTENISDFNKNKNVSDKINFSEPRRSVNLDNFEPIGSVMTSPVHTTHRSFETVRNISSTVPNIEPMRNIVSGSTSHTPLKNIVKKTNEPVLSDKSPPFDPSNKQKLREKLSADISEVHKVGKSVGGSLRALKDAKKNSGHEEDELFKPDKVTRSNSPEKSKKNTEEKNSKKVSEPSKSTEKNKDKKLSYHDYLKKTDKKEAEEKISKKSESSEVIDVMNNDELKTFVKDNMSTLPNLSTMEPDALRKLVKSFQYKSFLDNSNSNCNSPDIDTLSDISDQEFEEFLKGPEKEKEKEKEKKKENAHPLASVIMSKVGKDGVAKGNVNNKNDLELETIGDKTHDCSDMEISADECGENNEEDDQEFAERLLEDIPISKPPKLVEKRPSILDLPFSKPQEETPNEGIPFLDESNKNEIRRENEGNDPRWRPPPPLLNTQFPNQFANPYANEIRPEILVRPNTFEQPPRRPPLLVTPPSLLGQPPLLPTPPRPLYAPNLIYPQNDPAADYRQSQNVNFSNTFQNFDPRQQNQSSDARFRNINMPSDILSTGNTFNNIAVVRPSARPPNPDQPSSYGEYRQRKKENDGHHQRNVINVQIFDSPKCDYEKVPDIVKDKIPEIRSESFTKSVGDLKQKSASVPVKNVEEKRKANPIRDPRQTRWDDAKSRERSDNRDSYRNRNYRDEKRDERKSSSDRRRDSSDAEDLVSPLERLYTADDKPKTGRGYGLQNFKIPKKVREPLASPKEGPVIDAEGDKDKDKDKSVFQRSKISRDDISNSPRSSERGESPIAQKETPKVDRKEKIKKDETKKKSDSDKKRSDKSEKPKKTEEKTKIVNPKSNANAKERRRRIIIESSDSEDEKEEKSEVKEKKKEEKEQQKEEKEKPSEVESCDSQSMTEPEEIPVQHQEVEMETVPPPEKSPEKPKQVQSAATSTEVSENKSEKPSQTAEEIALVENIIKKSIESGESKLLLAKAKLFEKFTDMLSHSKKLSTKKFKKFQKLMRSLSGSDSSESSTSSDETEKKKKKKSKEEKATEKKEEKASEKKEEKVKEGKEEKQTKKGKEHKSRQYISDSSSTSEDSEEEEKEKKKLSTKEEEIEKPNSKEEKEKEKKKERKGRQRISDSSMSDDSEIQEVEKEDKPKENLNVKEKVEEEKKKKKVTVHKSKEYISDSSTSVDTDVEEVEADKEKSKVKEEPKTVIEEVIIKPEVIVKPEQNEQSEETPPTESETSFEKDQSGSSEQLTVDEHKVEEPEPEPQPEHTEEPVAAESQPMVTRARKKPGPKPKSKKRRAVRSEEFKLRKRKMITKERRLKKLLKDSQENSQDSNDSKVTEKKTKAKKGKTELDRLHEDIRSMFISKGVLTATGRRMCTLIKESGGSVKKLDMEKEFEEEKRKVTRSSTKIQEDDEATSRSQSADTLASSQSRSRNHSPVEAPKNDEKELEKRIVKNLPTVVLSKIDIEKFGFAYKISNDPISLRRMRGRNLARRGRSRIRQCRVPIKKERIRSPAEIKKEIIKNEIPENNFDVYLKRNIRKVMKLKNSPNKKVYKKNKLQDIIGKLIEKPQEELRILSPDRTNEKTRGSRKKKATKSGKVEGVFGRYNDQLKKKLIDYSFDKKRTTYDCLICLNSSASITSHYKSCHPESEVLISRLNQEEAEKAIADSKENNYDVKALEKGASLEAVKRRVKNKLNDRSYFCRMCTHSKINDPNLFFGHVSVHTGEYRYKCPAEACAMTAPSLENIKFHILSKHSKTKESLYDQVIEMFPMPTEYGNLYGYLCSKCHFVQTMRRNVENHVSTFHTDDIDVAIIKIDMSSKPTKKDPTAKEPPKRVIKTTKSKAVKRADEDGEETKRSTRSRPVEDKQPVYVEKDKPAKRKRKSEVDLLLDMQKKDTESEESEDSSYENFDPLESNSPEMETDGDSKSSEVAVFTEQVNEFVKNTVQMKNLQVNLKNQSDEKMNVKENDDDDDGSIFTASEKTQDLLEDFSSKKDALEKELMSPKKMTKVLVATPGSDQLVREVKAGPLESKMLVNMEILYECYVKGCIVTSDKFEPFEKHINFAHTKTKWDGVCQTCGTSVKIDNSLSAPGGYKLLAALLHLRSHEVFEEDLPIKDDKSSKEPKQNLDNEDSNEKANEEKIVQNVVKTEPEPEQKLIPESMSIEEHDESPNISVKSEESIKNEDGSPPFPVKPLLRVRTFLGDRLSKPKLEPIVSITEIPQEDNFMENSPETETSEPLFTIEDVRTLSPEAIHEPIVEINTSPQAQPGSPSTIRIENVGTLATLADFPQNANVMPGKSILVRSSPSPKISIRPGNPVIPISIAPKQIQQFKVIPSSINSPVIFTQMANSNNIRIIASSAISMSPLMVSQTPPSTATAKIVPIAQPTISHNLPKISAEATSNILEENPLLTQTVMGNKPSFETLRCSTPNNPNLPRKKVPIILKSPVKIAQAATAEQSSSPALVEFGQDEISTFRRPKNNATLGGKNVKDAKIYQEMLSKNKLCHLFKCMAVECSFTCNEENIFTQHIGLHEAQQRIKSQSKSQKTRKVFNWQQCAYCCEVIVQSGSALSQHILQEHGHCLYQCAYCFYRAVSQTYVTLHQNTVHSQMLDEQPKLILKCKPIPNLPVSKTTTEKQTRRQSVRPYHCVQCGSKFFITQEFMDHLAKEHQSVTAYTCHICKNLCFKADRLITHYKMHSYSMFQCAYCLHGAETKKEMLLHLCNCHFSQPAYMYVRAFAKGQNGAGPFKANKKKKGNPNHLDALEVITCEDDALSVDNIVEADGEESDGSDSGQRQGLSIDLTAIVTELGINVPEESSSSSINPVIRELMTIDNKNPETATVETLLPNAQFSSEMDNSSNSSSKDDSISVPLGQLPLEALGMQKIETTATPTPPKEVTEADKTLKLNEILINLSQRDKSITVSPVVDENVPKKVVATHKMPPTVSTSRIAVKNVYPAKTALKKQIPANDQDGKKSLPILYQRLSTGEKNEDEQGVVLNTGKNIISGGVIIHDKLTGKATTLPIVSKVVSMASNKDLATEENIPMISDVRSLSTENPTDEGNQIVINIQSKTDETPQLQPPIIRVEDFPLNADGDKSSIKKIKEPEKKSSERPESPEIIILDDDDEDEVSKPAEAPVDVIDIEAENGNPSKKRSIESEEASKAKKLKSDDAIRKEMERLRNQIENETDCLLDDDSSKSDTSTMLKLNVNEKISEDEGEKMLSPIEEAICSLNKKLESETARKSDGDKNRDDNDKEELITLAGDKECSVDSVKNPDKDDDASLDSCRDKNESEPVKKNEGNVTSEKSNLGLSGKDLYRCGNKSCSYAADNDVELKEHLSICDFSRESNFLSCPHCYRKIQKTFTFVEHLKLHGEKKYICGICKFASALEKSVVFHFKGKHKVTATKTMPQDSESKGYFVIYPKNHKTDLKNYESIGYSPGDEDKLPLQSIYQFNVKCAVCPYYTKVRSNMVRHLKIHVKSTETEGVVVPSTAPTNPVPCLDTKEKMFDKMTNLAASSQLAQAKIKEAFDSLTPEEEARLPQFVPEQIRFKCCASDCPYINYDDNMLRNHIKIFHAELTFYSCPHCKETVPLDFRNTSFDKIGNHLKYHDNKLYKCAHCSYFHHHKHIVDKHCLEKHPEKIFYIYTVREPKADFMSEEEVLPPPDNALKAWKCNFCGEFESTTRNTVQEHVLKVHNSKSKYKCNLCDTKSSQVGSFTSHFASKHPGEKVCYVKSIVKVNASSNCDLNTSVQSADSSKEHFDTTPLWKRDAPRVRHIRGILIEEEEVKTKKNKKVVEEDEDDDSNASTSASGDTFYCPLCTDKKKAFQTKSPEIFRSHLYQELNYQQFACILCGKMFVDKREFDKHHVKAHPDKPQAMKQTKEDGEIKFWVEKVIAKQREEIGEKKRRCSTEEKSTPKKKKPPPAKSPENPRSVLKKNLLKSPSGNKLTRSSSSSDSENFKIEYEKDFTCRHCQIKVSDLSSLKAHIKVTHLKLGRYRCTYCFATFQTEALAGKHCKNEHPFDQAKPELNPDAAKLKEDFWKTEYGFRNEKIIKNFVPKSIIRCRFCNFRDIPQLVESHEIQHLEATQFKCGHCEYKAGDRDLITLHIKNLHPGSKMLFSECPIIPNMVSSVKSNKNPETEIKNVNIVYCCRYCAFESNLENVLVEHLESEHRTSDLCEIRKETNGKIYFCCRDCSFRAGDVATVTKHGGELHGQSAMGYEKIQLIEYDFKDDIEQCVTCLKINCICNSGDESADEGSYNCPHCDYLTKSYNDCVSHFSKHFPKYSCRTCQMKFVDEIEFNKHSRETKHTPVPRSVEANNDMMEEFKATILYKKGGKWTSLGNKKRGRNDGDEMSNSKKFKTRSSVKGED